MKPSPLENILPMDDGADEGGDDKPSIGDALGVPDDEEAGSGADVTTEAKKECGEKLLEAFKANDPIAMFNAVAGVQSLVDQD